MSQAKMDEREVFRCNICGRITAWKDGAADDMPDACSKCWAKRHMLDIENNPAWKPFLDAAWKTTPYDPVRIGGYPKRLREVVALALSLAKWHLVLTGEDIDKNMWTNCGCCVLHSDEGVQNCAACLLGPGECDCICLPTNNKYSKDERPDAEVYSRILRIYTEHFNALPERDKQRLAA